MPASFEKEWTDIKKNFEGFTKKKKPSEKFLALFNKASGLTPATKAFDKTVDDDDKDGAEKALAALRKAAQGYQGTLAKAIAAEKDKAVVAETKVMYGEIDRLVEEAEKTTKDVGKIEYCRDISAVAKLLKSKSSGPRVREYAKKTHNEDTLLFLEAMAKKDYSKKTFKTFIAAGSKYEMNIDHDTRGQFKEDDLRAAPWDEVTDEVRKLFNQNVIQKMST